MTARRLLVVANEAVADRPAGVPEIVRRQVLEADEVRVIAPLLPSLLQSWTSDLDAAARSAGDRAGAVVSGMHAAGRIRVGSDLGDENPLQAIADALAVFPADALILAVHTPDVANRRERGLAAKARARFELPVTEMQIDGDGRVVSVTQHATQEAD